jgi:hypothetical protein
MLSRRIIKVGSDKSSGNTPAPPSAHLGTLAAVQETERLTQDPVEGITATVDSENKRYFHVTILGPKEVCLELPSRQRTYGVAHLSTSVASHSHLLKAVLFGLNFFFQPTTPWRVSTQLATASSLLLL